jgi:hypothetical protein
MTSNYFEELITQYKNNVVKKQIISKINEIKTRKLEDWNIINEFDNL